MFGTFLGTVTMLATAVAVAGPRPDTLKIYFIDVEGGQSTLIVSPDRKSVLIDTGYAGDGVGYRPGDPHKARDANRIAMAAHDANVTRINYLLITHFHDDHDGGVRELSQLMPIDHFVDHGNPSSQVASNTGTEQLDAFRVYSSVITGMPHWEPAPGARLSLKDLKVTVVSSAGVILNKPLPLAGSATTGCPDLAPAAADPYENPRSTGVVIEYGKFRFLDVGDLSGQPLYGLVCPRNLVGQVDAYLVAHHGGADVAYPATFQAFHPRVAIMNNGLKKGGTQQTYQALHEVKGLDTVWQLHRSEAAGDQNFAPDKIANLDESTAFWLELTAKRDGSFEVFNPRTNGRQSYGPRR
jgi:competence protein ComEC